MAGVLPKRATEPSDPGEPLPKAVELPKMNPYVDPVPFLGSGTTVHPVALVLSPNWPIPALVSKLPFVIRLANAGPETRAEITAAPKAILYFTMKSLLWRCANPALNVPKPATSKGLSLPVD